MTQEEKRLLLQDLSARLPYGVIVRLDYKDGTIVTGEMGIGSFHDMLFGNAEGKPYLRPMSSMTKEEMEELLNIDKKRGIYSSRHLTWHIDGEITDYLNKKMFDYRGLIPMNLALEAPKGIYTKKE